MNETWEKELKDKLSGSSYSLISEYAELIPNMEYTVQLFNNTASMRKFLEKRIQSCVLYDFKTYIGNCELLGKNIAGDLILAVLTTNDFVDRFVKTSHYLLVYEKDRRLVVCTDELSAN